ncbi:MAG: cytochrome P450 [Gemmataceae bacterium]|nr:cytochrome P450 [Gemmataceae bacterium]
MAQAEGPGSESIALFGPDMLDDPYPTYHRMRSTHPIYHAADGKWYLTRYADVAAALRSPALSCAGTDQLRRAFPQPELQDAFDGMARGMMHTDPPAHTRLRGLVSKAFTPHAVEAMTGRIQSIVDRLLDNVVSRGRMDVVQDLAQPLPLLVIGDMLGIPPEDRERVKAWIEAMTRLGDVPSVETFMAAAATRREVVAYLVDLVAQRRQQPREDLLSALAQAEDMQDRLTDAELYSNAILLLVAGNATTSSLIGTGTLSLLQHPEQKQKLSDTPALMESAVEEFLRFESPLQLALTPRLAQEDLCLGETTVPRGAFVALLFGAANRDPAQFPDPDRLDITRSPNHHLAFGAGSHFCLGAPLARLEARIVFNTLLRRFPKLRREAGPVEFVRYPSMRALKTLPVLL